MDDLQWMRDVTPFKPTKPYSIAINDDDLTEDNVNRIINMLHERYGVKWPNKGDGEEIFEVVKTYGLKFFIHNHDIRGTEISWMGRGSHKPQCKICEEYHYSDIIYNEWYYKLK